MRLRDLFSDDATIEPQAEAVVVSGIAVDSRAVTAGDLFFALAATRPTARVSSMRRSHPARWR